MDLQRTSTFSALSGLLKLPLYPDSDYFFTHRILVDLGHLKVSLNSLVVQVLVIRNFTDGQTAGQRSHFRRQWQPFLVRKQRPRAVQSSVSRAESAGARVRATRCGRTLKEMSDYLLGCRHNLSVISDPSDDRLGESTFSDGLCHFS